MQKRKLTIVFLFFVFGAALNSAAQKRTIQDSVQNLFFEFAHAANAEEKMQSSIRFSDGLKTALQLDAKGAFAFDSLKKYKVLIQTPDKDVKVFTWDVEAEDGTHTFFGFVHAYIKKLKKFETYQLTDKSDGVRDPENAIVDNTNWFGAYYYQIIPVKYKKKKYFVLLGWDGNNRISNKRLIDVLYLSDKGFPKFGAPIFYNEQMKLKKRIIFEFQAGLFMSLKYEESNDAILFDHLSPSNPNLIGEYSFYGPDFSYDMMKFKDGKWVYIKDVLPRNDKGKPDKYFNTPK